MGLPRPQRSCLFPSTPGSRFHRESPFAINSGPDAIQWMGCLGSSQPANRRPPRSTSRFPLPTRTSRDWPPASRRGASTSSSALRAVKASLAFFLFFFAAHPIPRLRAAACGPRTPMSAPAPTNRTTQRRLKLVQARSPTPVGHQPTIPRVTRGECSYQVEKNSPIRSKRILLPGRRGSLRSSCWTPGLVSTASQKH